MRRAVAPLDSETQPLTVPSVLARRIDRDVPVATSADESAESSSYISRLTQAVGWRLVVITWVMYGLDQGGIESINDLGMIYFWKGRGLEPVQFLYNHCSASFLCTQQLKGSFQQPCLGCTQSHTQSRDLTD